MRGQILNYTFSMHSLKWFDYTFEKSIINKAKKRVEVSWLLMVICKREGVKKLNILREMFPLAWTQGTKKNIFSFFFLNISLKPVFRVGVTIIYFFNKIGFQGMLIIFYILSETLTFIRREVNPPPPPPPTLSQSQIFLYSLTTGKNYKKKHFFKCLVKKVGFGRH